jgi:hypothetical protein
MTFGVRQHVMRKNLASLAMLFCLSSAVPALATSNTTDEATAVAVQQVRMPLPGVRDEVAMVLVGTALIGLAAAVRRSA